MENKIFFTDLIGKKIKSIKSGSELVLAYYLNEYSKQFLNAELSFEGVMIPRTIRINNKMFSYLHDIKKMPFILEQKKEDERVRKINVSRFKRNIFEGDLSNVVFENKTDKKWIYSYSANKEKNLILNRIDRSTAYVKLYAYILFKHFLDNKDTPTLMLKNNSHMQHNEEYVDLLILEKHGNKLLSGKIEISFSDKVHVNPMREADVVYKRQLGFMLEKSNVNKKREYMNKHFKVGDVVLLYELERYGKNNDIRDIKHCYPAVIKSIDEYGFGLEFYPIIQTLLTRVNQLENFKNSKHLNETDFSEKEYEKFVKNKEHFDFVSTGIDLLSYKEEFFIHIPFNNKYERFEQVIVDRKGKIHKVLLNTTETIYAVFEDRNIEYNKERFLKKYFGYTKPVYDKLKGR